ncbi:MAG: BCCT family transporter [Micavibrio sp.]|nr:MAG: BCCT family transporter [Micavibrio sp.]
MLQIFRQPVFLISVAVIAALVTAGSVYPEVFEQAAGTALDRTTEYFGWFYLLSVFGFVAVLVYLACSGYGNIRLGRADSRPEYSFFSWVAMLLAAGFGVGLVFYGMAEPMSHYLNPPHGQMEGLTPEAARLAIQYSFFNWGVHQWAAFAIVGLIIAFFQFRKGEPGLVSTVLRPATAKLAKGRDQIGGAFDIFAVVATVMGVATSIGLGVMQINGGLHFLFADISEGIVWQAVILVALAAAYIVSTITGLHRGIRVLSTFNLALALGLMLFVLIAGPTRVILESIVQGIGDYLQNFFVMGMQTAVFEGSTWAREWTVFYWAWVIAWSPFVGAFIARISKGRTIREYIFGVLVMPPLLACLWIGIFGTTALYMDMTAGAGLAAATDENMTTALFKLFAVLPLPQILSVLGLILIFIFLVTSADSATYIIAQMTDRGSINPPLAKRLIWGGLLAAICLTLIATGGLRGLQAGAVLSALPFTFLIYAMIWILFRELAADKKIKPE